MLMLINSRPIYPRANLVTKVTTAAPWGLSSVNYRTVLVSTTVTLGMAVVHSNICDQKLRRHVNQMWQSLYARSQDRLGLLLADDDELWQLTVVRTEMTDMIGPAHVDICRRAGKVCIRYVDRPVASGAHYEFSLKSKRDRTCATSRRVELLRLRQTDRVLGRVSLWLAGQWTPPRHWMSFLKYGDHDWIQYSKRCRLI